MSKQLASMKKLGLVESRREGTWMLYAMAEPINRLVGVNLRYLREADCTECNQLQLDLLRRERLILRIRQTSNECPESVCQQIGCC